MNIMSTADQTPITAAPAGVVVRGALEPRFAEILTPEALAFVATLHRKFDARRVALLQARAVRQKRITAGELPDFLPETDKVRQANWRVGPIPADLLNRRVEITGPVDRKMIINALNSGANVFMADFEDANSPTWHNNLEGQVNLTDRWQRSIDFKDAATGKQYALGASPAVLMVRPRGWHLMEPGLTVDGAPVAGGLFDFGLYFFHNVRAQLARGTGPYFYLPKLESHLEARLWNDVFAFAQQQLGIANGTIKVTVLIETCRPHSRWTKSSTNCATTSQASTVAAGTTCSRHQEAACQQSLRAAGSLAGGDGQGVPARVLTAADQDLPPPGCLRHGGHGRADSQSS